MVAMVVAVVAFAALASSREPTTGVLRVDQLGYRLHGPKLAYLMSTGAVSGERYTVATAGGTIVARGAVPAAARGRWNARFPDVYALDLSALEVPGRYRFTVRGPVSATSPPFTIAAPATLYGPLVADGVAFLQSQRDGADVIPGSLNRRPSHLNDAHAPIDAAPSFAGHGCNGDAIQGALTPAGGQLDASGGWFDAGDYLKFTFTAAYADETLYAAHRALGPAAPASLAAEAQYGTGWLQKMWNPATRTLAQQVGIGSGNGRLLGDHDLWRLPQADDGDTAPDDVAAAAHRPVFLAAAPGAPIDPDLAGRVAAALASAAQADAPTDPGRATRELADATTLYGQANTHPVPNACHLYASVLPPAYYPEPIWHDAMELAAAEIVRAQQALGAPAGASMPYLRQAATWAADYIAHDSGADTLNLYDVAALAHAELVTAIRAAGTPAGLAVTPAQLLGDLRAQLAGASRHAAADLFRAGFDARQYDADAHTFGLIATEAFYRHLSGDDRFAAFADAQRDWLLGDNPWGTSFMVGVGTTFPHCMQSQLANLSGSLDGRPPVDIGAVVNGPNSAGTLSGALGTLQTGMRRCGSRAALAFTGHGIAYVDDVRAYQTNEPALDMTAAAILAAALQSV